MAIVVIIYLCPCFFLWLTTLLCCDDMKFYFRYQTVVSKWRFNRNSQSKTRIYPTWPYVHGHVSVGKILVSDWLLRLNPHLMTTSDDWRWCRWTNHSRRRRLRAVACTVSSVGRLRCLEWLRGLVAAAWWTSYWGGRPRPRLMTWTA